MFAVQAQRRHVALPGLRGLLTILKYRAHAEPRLSPESRFVGVGIILPKQRPAGQPAKGQTNDASESRQNGVPDDRTKNAPAGSAFHVLRLLSRLPSVLEVRERLPEKHLCVEVIALSERCLRLGQALPECPTVRAGAGPLTSRAVD